MTKPTKPRPVVRVVIEVYPKDIPHASEMLDMREWAAGAADSMGSERLDYRRPRVVSVKRVRARRA